MTAASVEPRPWPRRRWWGMVVLVFVVQLGLIFWLGDRTPIRPRPAAAALTLQLATAGIRRTAGAQRSHAVRPAAPAGVFRAGCGWVCHDRNSAPSIGPEPTALTFPWLLTGSAPSSTAWSKRTDLHLPQLPAQPEPAPTLPDLPPLAAVAGPIGPATGGWPGPAAAVTPLQLRSWPNPDLLTNSVVQVVVDAEGRPVSRHVALEQRFGGGGPIRAGPGQGRAVRTRGPQSGRNQPQSHGAFDLGQDDLPVAHAPDAAHRTPRRASPLTARSHSKCQACPFRNLILTYVVVLLAGLAGAGHLLRAAPAALRADPQRGPHLPLPPLRLRLYRRPGRGPLALLAMRADEQGDRVLKWRWRVSESDGVMEMIGVAADCSMLSCITPLLRLTPSLHHSSLAPFRSAPRLQFHHIVRRGLALAGGADADEAGLLAQLGEVGRAQVAHAGLDAADQLRQHAVHRAAHFLQRLDPFRARPCAPGRACGRSARPSLPSSPPNCPCRGTACRACRRSPSPRPALPGSRRGCRRR